MSKVWSFVFVNFLAVCQGCMMSVNQQLVNQLN